MIPVEAGHHTLESRLVRAEGSAPLALIAPPHPVYGGTIGNPVVRALERAYQAAGHSTLAFNFRGTGESTGEPSGEQSQALVDYLAVAQSVPDAKPAWLSGYSFGSVAALAAAIELEVPRVLMVAPPLELLDPALLRRYRGQLALAVGSEDEYAPVAAVRELLDRRADTVLKVIEGAEHFFFGSAVQRLAPALQELLGGEVSP